MNATGFLQLDSGVNFWQDGGFAVIWRLAQDTGAVLMRCCDVGLSTGVCPASISCVKHQAQLEGSSSVRALAEVRLRKPGS